MSGVPQHQHPLLADHIIFVVYRWLTWVIAGSIVLWQGAASDAVLLLMLSALVNVLATVVAQPYVRLVQRVPALMSLDVVYAVVVLFGGGGWYAPFALYGTSSLVLPALMFGWRGGIMAGLLFVSLDLALNLSNDRAPSNFIEQGRLAELLVLMAAPPLFGCLFPSLVELLRRVVARHVANRGRKTPPSGGARVDRAARPDTVGRRAAPGRNANSRERAGDVSLLPARTTAVRAAEQSAEELRRVIFAPFPAPDGELPAVLDLLAARFGQHTRVATRVTLLGRTRAVHFAQRSALVRLAQEALLNIHQHAHAGAIELTLRYDAHSVALLIQDDGVGLLDGTYERPGLHALRAMHYRLAELGGRLDVFETEGGGVTVRATAPLE